MRALRLFGGVVAANSSEVQTDSLAAKGGDIPLESFCNVGCASSSIFKGFFIEGTQCLRLESSPATEQELVVRELCNIHNNPWFTCVHYIPSLETRVLDKCKLPFFEFCWIRLLQSFVAVSESWSWIPISRDLEPSLHVETHALFQALPRINCAGFA